jgi:uncharacterized protein YkwD
MKIRGKLLLVLLAVAALAAPSSSAATVPALHAHKRHHHRHHRRHHHRHGAKQSAATAHSASVTTPASPVASSAAAAVPAAAPAVAAPLVPVPPCANADTSAIGASASDMRIAVECLVNQARMAKGLPPLADNAELTTSAQNWTDWMVANDQFTHGSDFAGRITAVGYDWQEAGENIATGYDTPQEVVNAWLASPEHCQNIMNPDYVSIGTGINTAPVAGFATDPSTWTQDFGLTTSESAPSTNQGPMNACPYGG